MNVNLDRGGIIWQARLHMASAPYVRPLDEDEGEFHTFAMEMANARYERGEITNDEVTDSYKHLVTESKLHPIGRVARKVEELPSGKRLYVNLALLNESVGIMPAYWLAEPSIKKIGRASLVLHSVDQHTHSASDISRHESQLSGGFDILTNGKVRLTRLALEMCNDCPNVRLHDEVKILSRLGLGELLRVPAALVPAASRDPYSERTSHIFSRTLTGEQASGLQGFLAEQFTPKEY